MNTLAIVLFAATLALVRAADQHVSNDISWKQAAQKVNVLPQFGMRTIRPEDREALRVAARLSRDDALRLVESTSATERGVGLWSLYATEEYQSLFEFHHLLDDHAPTLPYGAPMAGVHQFVYADQSVSEYLNALYADFLGAPAGSAANFEETYRGVESVDQLVQPWVTRLVRAADDAERLAAVKAAVRELPENQRWLVLQLAAWWLPPGYTPEEAASEFALLSDETKRKIMNGSIEPPLDPMYRKRVAGRAVHEWRDGEPSEWALRTARSYLTGAALEEKPAEAPP